jgi:hypothetical protein
MAGPLSGSPPQKRWTFQERLLRLLTSLLQKDTWQKISWTGSPAKLVALALAALYALVRYATQGMESSPVDTLGEFWGGVLLRYMRGLSSLIGVTNSQGVSLPKRTKIDANRQYMLTMCPHGAFAWTAMHHGPQMSISKDVLGFRIFCTVAPPLFRVPILRELLLAINARGADYRTCVRLLDAGRSVAFSPGAIYEQLNCRSDQEIAFFPPKLGFIRLAIRYGTPIIPTYSFGENQIYNTSKMGTRFSKWLYRISGFGIPLVTGWN